MIACTNTIDTNERGKKIFHVRAISLSYRMRGYAPRAQINSTLIIVLTIINQRSFIKGLIFTGINSAVINRLIAIMFIYSAIKIRAKVPALYSVLNPDTSSDSPSVKSKGVRFVSAKAVINQVMARGHNSIVSPNDIRSLIVLKLRVARIISGVSITKAIVTSYEIVWAILRRAPRSAYLLFDDQPLNKVVYTFILEMHKNTMIPHFK